VRSDSFFVFDFIQEAIKGWNVFCYFYTKDGGLMRYIFLFFLANIAAFADTKILTLEGTAKPEPVFDSSILIEKLLQNQKESSPDNYRSLISRYAKQYGLDASLVAAIIKVESNFDHRAVSATDALGLMQVKLDQAVSDVYKSMYGRYDLPRREQLFEPQFNISIGSAYLYLVSSKYFKEIKDPKTKEYCIIAAYNAGAGTVLRTFHEDKLMAQNIINSYTPDEVLRKLKGELASEQGKRYLLKVMEAKREFDKEYGKSGTMESMVFFR
jgi:soluble lytic murein transglycosylase-like protein